MKKILLSLVFVGLLTTVSFSLTRAYFTDKETVKGSKFSVGTLDLNVSGDDGSGTTGFEINDIGSGPNSGTKSWQIKNVGSLPGILSLNLRNVLSQENGCNSPESQVDTSCGNPGDSEGELDDTITATFYLDNQQLSSSKLNSTSDLLASLANPVIIPAGTTKVFRLDWSAGEYGNEIQSDTLSLDLDFNLKQQTN